MLVRQFLYIKKKSFDRLTLRHFLLSHPVWFFFPLFMVDRASMHALMSLPLTADSHWYVAYTRSIHYWLPSGNFMFPRVLILGTSEFSDIWSNLWDWKSKFSVTPFLGFMSGFLLREQDQWLSFYYELFQQRGHQFLILVHRIFSIFLPFFSFFSLFLSNFQSLWASHFMEAFVSLPYFLLK